MSGIEHDAAARCFATVVAGHRAVLTYQLAGNEMTITHTQVPSAIAGQGVAAELTRAALAHAHSAGWRVVAACSYAAAYMQRHADAEGRQHTEELLDEALDESFPASDPPSVGASS